MLIHIEIRLRLQCRDDNQIYSISDSNLGCPQRKSYPKLDPYLSQRISLELLTNESESLNCLMATISPVDFCKAFNTIP